jgi:hypothetical protein
MSLLIRLYPASWRARYEDEFLAFLEERPVSPFDAFDILLGALDAHLRPRSLAIELAPRRNPPMNARIAGLAAMVGGALILIALPTAWLQANMPEDMATIVQVMLVLGIEVALLVALIGLSAVQGRRRPVLTWSAVAVPITAVVVSVLGSVGMVVRGDEALVAGVSSWYLWSFGLIGLVAGSVLFAAATAMLGVFSRPAALTLLAGSVLMVLAVLPLGFGLVGSASWLLPVAMGSVALFAAGWIWLGYAATHPRPVESGGLAR